MQIRTARDVQVRKLDPVQRRIRELPQIRNRGRRCRHRHHRHNNHLDDTNHDPADHNDDAAAPSEAKLEVNENCVEPEWPCWTAPGSKPEPASKVTIAAGGEVMFTDHDATTAAAVVWIGAAPACSGVPTSATANWEGRCKFEQPGTYKFESSTLFIGDGLNYTKYEIVVEVATGTTPITPSSPGGGGTTTSPPSSAGGSGSGAAPGSPLAGSAAEAVKLARVQHGSSVRGS